MDTLILCDTDVLIDYFNKNSKRHQQTVNTLNNIKADGAALISIITEIELVQGVSNKREMQIILKNLKSFDRISLHPTIADEALRLIKSYKLSHGLTIPDAFIAATALVLEIPLFTYNVKDFKFISNLELEEVD